MTHETQDGEIEVTGFGTEQHRATQEDLQRFGQWVHPADQDSVQIILGQT